LQRRQNITTHVRQDEDEEAQACIERKYNEAFQMLLNFLDGELIVLATAIFSSYKEEFFCSYIASVCTV